MKRRPIVLCLFLAACGPYDRNDARQMAERTEAARPKSIDSEAQHRYHSGVDQSNRSFGADLATRTDYYYDPATGYCFAYLYGTHNGGISAVSCDKVWHMLLNPPPRPIPE